MKSISNCIPRQKAADTLSAKQVSNQTYINIYNACERMPQAMLTKNVGSQKTEQHVTRGWRGDQLVIFHRNKMKLKDHFEELALQERNVEKLKADSIRNTVKAVADHSTQTLSNEVDNLTAVINEWEEKKREMVDLPELEKLPFADIANLEISNTPYMGIVMEYMVDIDK